jgi:hypothetical protein
VVSERHPDPERQRLGRLGALTVHARGRTNVGPARAAWEARLASEFGITDELIPAERQRRLDYALRIRMTELARLRWTKKTAPGGSDTPERSEEAAHAGHPDTA